MLGDSRDHTLGTLGCDDGARDIDLRHDPAAENIAALFGIRRHGNDTAMSIVVNRLSLDDGVASNFLTSFVEMLMMSERVRR
ncbi:MAG TPA: hypothetical protein VJM53_06995 [Burkholderiales bacterium]|nr:hypothetical protein [Burkholderiales bacterium]